MTAKLSGHNLRPDIDTADVCDALAANMPVFAGDSVRITIDRVLVLGWGGTDQYRATVERQPKPPKRKWEAVLPVPLIAASMPELLEQLAGLYRQTLPGEAE